ncbi:T9SS type A sorting domain-containing protein [Gramella jeungdoensis]|uniref:T9SS type A sorting domain-containing protein n=1 Tax=Gramella jeungdoensis TaxID=708091 RepID=A0ABT0Z5U7_9FLAO|nr:T9SS type A sorting domain-containing protein [Gramella jeungdoensis]MCM8571103.1 T9SS type A sorting domain-containing protein [Gramella jeungdoensis]
MKLPLLFLMIFSVSGIYAQLYIAPSEKSDSYLYAKDRLLYVENEIHLTENLRKETQASIYFRNEAQLIQGAKNISQNEGSGKISVFQEGTSNAYDYNYWGLPVRIGDKNKQLNDFIYEPLSNTESRNAKLISALDGSSDPLSISNRWIYTFSGTSYSNWHYAGDHFDLKPGEGFTMKGVNGINLKEIEGQPINAGSSQIYDFRGMPNDGKIELPIQKDQTLLVGNPYPSALDLDKFLTENTSSTGIAYFWDSRKNGNSHYLSDYEGGYGTYSPGAGIYVPAIFRKYPDGTETGEIGQLYARDISPIAQGFMVIGKNEGKIVFQNSQRVFQKEEPGVSEFKNHETAIPSLRLNIEMDSTYIRQLVLALRDNATPDEDHAMDARKMDSAPSDVNWSLSGEAYIINVRPKKDEELIPLKVKLEKETSLKFSVAELNNFNPDRLFIYDSKDDLYFGIKTGYLKLSLAKGEYNERFYLSYIEKLPTSKTDPEAPEGYKPKPPNILLNTIDIFQNNREEKLELKVLYDTGISSFRLYDLNGKIIFSQSFKGNQKDFALPTGNLSNAVYIVKVNTTDQRELTKKIGIKN